MRRHPLPGSWLLLVLTAGLSSATHAQDHVVAPTGDACERLVSFNVQRMERSAVMEFQTRAEAHKVTKLLLDPLSANPSFGAKWREGDPFWEEAYAVLNTDVLAHMKATGAQELRHQEANLPRQLDPETCRKHWALLSSKHGAIAERIQEALDTKDFLASYEKAFTIPPRLRPWAEKVRQRIGEGTALLNDPDVRRDEGLYRKAREELRAYGKRLAEGLRKIGDSRGAEQQKASREYAQQMMARHQDELVAILRRFRSANGP